MGEGQASYSVPDNQGPAPGGEPDLFAEVYQSLKEIARQRMASQPAGHTLQATALVHEAYLKVVGGGAEARRWNDRAHFFRAAAVAMRNILVDHARSRGALKRGGASAGADAGRARPAILPLGVLDLAAEPDSEAILALDDAIRRLEGLDAQVAEVVRLRFYAGLTVDDTAEALGISPRSVDRAWTFARAWLYRELQPDR